MSVLVVLEAIAKEDCVDAFKQYLKERLPETRAFAGCQSQAAYVGVDDPRSIVFVERWESRAAHEAYLAWRRDTGARTTFASMLDGAPAVRYFEVLDA